MSVRLDRFAELGALSPLDVHFARSVGRLAREAREEVLLAAALVSHQTGAGHVCLSIPDVQAQSVFAGTEEHAPSTPVLPEPSAWLEALRSSPLVGRGDAPLVLDEAGRLYLERYWRHEEQTAAELRRRASECSEVARSPELETLLNQLFPLGPEGRRGPARSAAEAVLDRPLVVITGGPGTGKTSTVVGLLALLAEERRARGGPSLTAALLAPTGKAAARLRESIRERKATLPCPERVKQAIPEATSTVHRALGWRRATPTRFLHDQDHPLAADVVVVDEASMIDLALLAKLLAATPKRAPLILLGDEDQLSSVEVGAILGDICNVDGRGRASTAPISRCIFRLEESHRFGADSGIGALARAIQAGDATAALDLLRDPARADVRLVEPRGHRGLPSGLFEEALTHYRPYLEAEDPVARARAFGRYRVLCAHLRGTGGVLASNLELERRFARAGLLKLGGPSYEGRPIMIGQNDYGLELYNGDVGFIARASDGELRAQFVSSDHRVRSLSPARLPRHETVFAMTIHKSQGSEMDHVSIVLPDDLSPILSRELLYTAITRARVGVTIYARPEVVTAAVGRRIQRASGLTDRLWAPTSGLT